MSSLLYRGKQIYAKLKIGHDWRQVKLGITAKPQYKIVDGARVAVFPKGAQELLQKLELEMAAHRFGVRVSRPEAPILSDLFDEFLNYKNR